MNKEIFNTADKKEIQNAKVLIVEDDDLNQDVIKLFLKNVIDLDLVSTSYDAIRKAKEYNYSLILMDIGLSGTSGLDTTRIIRELPQYKNTPVIAVTAHAMRSDKERFLSEGIDYVISKPYEKAELVNSIKKYLGLQK